MTSPAARPAQFVLPPGVVARTDSSPVVRFGGWSIGTAFALFLLWALFVPIASSVATMGTLVSDGRNKVVQHPTGGLVRAIRVRSGDRVMEGDALIELDEARARAELTKLQARVRMLRAARNRLAAQLGRAPVADPVTAPAGPLWSLRGGDVVTASATNFADAVGPVERSEADIFTFGRREIGEELATLEAKIETLERQRDGLEARVEATAEMLELARAERDRLEPLVASGYVARNRLRERDKAVIELEGTLVSQRQEARGIETRITEIEHERARVKAADLKASSADLSRIETELAELSDQLVAAQQGLAMTVLRAPVAGTVVKLAVSTQGGVVGAGDVLAEIVPDAATMEVTARVAPADIAQVDVGDEARITLTAFTWRGDDPLPARVAYVEADARQDERTGESYFEVSVRPTAAAAATPAGRRLVADMRAGMQAEVRIVAGERTFASYLIEPIARSFRGAFRES